MFFTKLFWSLKKKNSQSKNECTQMRLQSEIRKNGRSEPTLLFFLIAYVFKLRAENLRYVHFLAVRRYTVTKTIVGFRLKKKKKKLRPKCP